MNEVWNLDPIYHGFDDPAFERDMQALKAAISGLEAFSQNLAGMDPTEGLREGLLLQEQLSSLVNRLAEYASLRQAANTLDADAGSQLGRIMGIYSGCAAPVAAFEGWAASIPDLSDRIASDELLSQYLSLIHI